MKKIRFGIFLLLAFFNVACSSEINEGFSYEEETIKEQVLLPEESSVAATSVVVDEPNKTSENNNAAKIGNSFYGKLQVNGSKLTDSNGNIVQLQGLSTHGIAWFPDYVNQDVLRQMKEEWGCNVFRIAMYTDENGGYAVSSDSDRRARKELIDKGVQAAIAEDMYVIIDWHILHDNNPLQHKDLALEFFSEMSEKYADIPNVIYEICNEPNGGTSWDDVKKYAKEVIPVIRKNSPDSIILVGTPTWCQEVDKAVESPLTEFDNIMYTLHFYASTHKDDLRNRAKAAAEKGLPMFVSEFGVCEASGNGTIDENQANQWLDLLNEYDISYCLWSLCNKNETASFFVPECNKKSGFAKNDLAQAGRWFINRPGRAQAGGGKVSSSDTDQSAKTNQTTDSISIAVSNSWNDGKANFYQYGVGLTNNTGKNASGWCIKITFRSDITFSSGWCGVFEVTDKTLTIKPESYNKEIASGSSLQDIGFILSSSENLEIVDYNVIYEN